MADRDRGDPAEPSDALDQFVVEVGDHVPQHVAGRRPDEERTLADRGRRLGADADDSLALVPDLAPVPGGPKLSQTRPALAAPPDVLAIVEADRAVIAGTGVLNAAGRADRQVGIHDSRLSKPTIPWEGQPRESNSSRTPMMRHRGRCERQRNAIDAIPTAVRRHRRDRRATRTAAERHPRHPDDTSPSAVLSVVGAMLAW